MNRATFRQCVTVVAGIAAITVGLLGCHHAEKAPPVPRSETPPIVVDDAFRERGIGLDLDFLEDTSAALTIEDVRAKEHADRFVPSTKAVPNFGYTNSAYWVRFSLEDKRDGAKHSSGDALELTLAFALTDLADLWCFGADDSTIMHARAGDHVLLAEWPSTYREPSFPIPRAARRCFLRVESSAIQLPLTLRTHEAFASHRLGDTTAQFSYFGALLVMIAYNGLVAVSSRTRAYGYYTLFLVAYALLQCTVAGFGYTVLWRDAVGWADRAVPVFVCLSGLTSISFASLLLDVPRTAPAIWKLARITMALFAIHLSVAWSFSYAVASRSVFAIMVLWAFFLLGSGLIQSWRGVRVAKLYLSAWTIFIFGAVVNVLRGIGIFPTNTLTVNAMQIGSAMEFVLLSFALADRIKTLQAEVATQANLATHHANLARVATERALAEQERSNAELKRLDALKDEFLANTSHELRTPLHGILGLTEGVLRSSTHIEPGNRDRLEMVVASGRRLASLVNDILDFSKLRHQELTLREKDVDLRAAVSLALSVVSPMAEAKSLALANDVPPGFVVRADEARLQQILTNLIGNAVKFTPAGSVRVFAALEGERLLVSVQDTGVGVSIEAQGRIFESFEQGDGSTAREFGGTGLGLAVTKKLVELHGGTVRVASAPGEGSTFTFDVAVASDDALGAVHDGAEAPRGSIVLQAASRVSVAMVRARVSNEPATTIPRSGSRPPSSLRLLVADDDPVNLEVLRAQLEPEGHEIVTARDGQQAVDALYSQGPFDGVLLDVMMPVMTGPQAAARMRADYPHGTLPILMLTAKNRPEDVVAGLKAGADDYVGKPFHRDELIARLDVHLDASKTTRALERFVSSALVNLAGEERPAALHPGQGRGRNVLIGRFAMHGLSEFAARLDEATFFKKMNRIVQVLVEQVELHGGIVETMVDEGLCVLFEGDAHGAISTMTHALRAARDVAGTDMRLGAVLHAGHVNVGVVGTAQWVSLRAMGESVLIAGALGRWGVSRGFGVLVTDAVVGKLDEREELRRIGTARLGEKGHPVTVFEVAESDRDPAELDSLVELLERAQFGRVNTALEGAAGDDPLVRHLASAAAASECEVRLV